MDLVSAFLLEITAAEVLAVATLLYWLPGSGLDDWEEFSWIANVTLLVFAPLCLLIAWQNSRKVIQTYRQMWQDKDVLILAVHWFGAEFLRTADNLSEELIVLYAFAWVEGTQLVTWADERIHPNPRPQAVPPGTARPRKKIRQQARPRTRNDWLDVAIVFLAAIIALIVGLLLSH